MTTWLMSEGGELLNVEHVIRIRPHGPDLFACVVGSDAIELVRCGSPEEAEATIAHLVTSLSDPNEGIAYESPIGVVVRMDAIRDDRRTKAGRPTNPH